MSYYNWFHDYFDKKHKNNSIEEKLNDLFLLLESRSNEYLQHNHEIYKKLYIDKDEKILYSQPQIIQQVKQEIYDFLKLIINNNVQSCLQIGLGHFGSTHFLISFLCKKIVTIEYDINHIVNYCNREIFYNQNKEVLIYGDSTDLKTKIEAEFHGPYDCVFIDGNHTYDYVKKDFNNYFSMLKSGGICAFHDALLLGDKYGVPQLLSEIDEDVKFISHSTEVGIAYFYK